jgi:hypothetical protein
VEKRGAIRKVPAILWTAGRAGIGDQRKDGALV